MKWTIYNPKKNQYVHPGVYHDAKFPNMEWITIEWKDNPYFFADTYELTKYLRNVDENGNECVQLEGCMYMMCLENRP